MMPLPRAAEPAFGAWGFPASPPDVTGTCDVYAATILRQFMGPVELLFNRFVALLMLMSRAGL